MTGDISQHGCVATDAVQIRMANPRELEFHEDFSISRDWNGAIASDFHISGGRSRRCDDCCGLGLRGRHIVKLEGFDMD
jgi:hypothetical protein